MNTKTILLTICIFLLISCESEQSRSARIQREQRQKIEREAQIERDRAEREIINRYINNSLPNGSTPFAYCYGVNGGCSSYGCSQIKVKTPYSSDVLVTIKRSGKVVRHAYIVAGSSYTFDVSNGTYQPFFYYGKGWNPDKLMKNTSCGELKGGFVSDEQFGKDTPQSLNNNILEYELILQQHGNFSTKPSNQNEAF